MKRLTTAAGALLLILTFGTAGFADTFVRGYYRSDGTYVQPHYRSSPDSSYNNNWSVRPNINPHTGKRGTRSPTFNDRPPRYNNSLGGSGRRSPLGSPFRR